MGNLVSEGWLGIDAGNDIINYSSYTQAGYIEGVDVTLSAGNDIINRTEYEQFTEVTNSDKHGDDTFSWTSVAKTAEIVSHNNLSMDAGNNIDLQGSQLSAANDMSNNRDTHHNLTILCPCI